MIPLDTLTAIHATLAILLHAINKDAINGGFEIAGGFFALNHCRVLYAHKAVRGVSMLSVAFFLSWGMWNLYYYPSLNQPMSFYGALFLVAGNAFYLGMIAYYNQTFSYPLTGKGEIYLGPESGGGRLQVSPPTGERHD